jgi:hypothetical protein
VLIEAPAEAREHVSGLSASVHVSVADEAHDLGVGVHRREPIKIVLAPPPQDQPFGLEPTFG